MKQDLTQFFLESKKELKNVFQNTQLLVIILISFFLNIFLWLFILLTYKNFQEIAVIHYSVLSGINWLDKKIYLFLFPLVGFVIFFVNFILITLLYKKNEKTISFFLVIASFLVNVFLIVSFILLYTL